MANAVIDAIMQATTDPHVRASMIMGAGLESSWNVNAVGDAGKSFGPYQIYTVAHPNVTASQAKDPVWATNYMLPSYRNAVSKVSPSLWQSNPAMAAATAAFYAERPKVMYPTSTITAKWPTVQAALNGQDLTGPVTGGDGIVQAVSNPLDAVGTAIDTVASDFKHGVMTAANFALFFAAVFVGGLLVATGVVLLFKETSAGDSVGRVKSAFGTTLGAVNPLRSSKG
jgi:hypothetical protein